MSIIEKFKDLLEAIKRKNADTTRYDLDEMLRSSLARRQTRIPFVFERCTS